jgi:universal stress protein A
MTPEAARDNGGPHGVVARILLATDLSHVSDVATDWAFDLARRVGASLVVVSVIDPRDLRLPGGRFLARIDQVRERRETSAMELVQRGRRMGVAVTFLVWDGDPAESIVSAAASERADLVVVGSHGRSGVGRMLLGSVSDKVVRNAPCPVLVARAVSDGATQPRQAVGHPPAVPRFET